MDGVETSVSQGERSLTFRRTLHAPRQWVFEVLSHARHVAAWWGPEGWSVPVCTIDFRVGGRWHYCFRGAGGEEHWGLAIYREIVPPERIVYRHTLADAEGNSVGGMPPNVTTITLREIAGGTQLIAHVAFESATELDDVLRAGMRAGFEQSLEHLEAYVARSWV